jgi:hypothetical protein
LHALDTRVAEIEAVILAWHKENEVGRRLATIPGIGPITASAIVATVGDAAQFGSARQLEPPRVWRRPQPLRGWGHDEEDVEPVFARDPRAGGADGAGPRGRPRLAVVGDRLDRGEDRLHDGGAAAVGAAGRA